MSGIYLDPKVKTPTNRESKFWKKTANLKLKLAFPKFNCSLGGLSAVRCGNAESNRWAEIKFFQMKALLWRVGSCLWEIIFPGPFKATELWNSIVRHVRENVEVGRRRVRMKRHDRCFSGTEVVDVVLEWLVEERGNFTKDVTREKAVKVNKFFVFHAREQDAMSSCTLALSHFLHILMPLFFSALPADVGQWSFRTGQSKIRSIWRSRSQTVQVFTWCWRRKQRRLFAVRWRDCTKSQVTKDCENWQNLLEFWTGLTYCYQGTLGISGLILQACFFCEKDRNWCVSGHRCCRDTWLFSFLAPRGWIRSGLSSWIPPISCIMDGRATSTLTSALVSCVGIHLKRSHSSDWVGNFSFSGYSVYAKSQNQSGTSWIAPRGAICLESFRQQILCLISFQMWRQRWQVRCFLQSSIQQW